MKILPLICCFLCHRGLSPDRLQHFPTLATPVVGEIEASGTDSNPFNQDVAFFAMVTASKHQRRTSGIWWADSVPELKLKFYAQVTELIGGGTPNIGVFTSIGAPGADMNGWFTEYNSSSIEKSEDYCFSTCFLEGYTINSYWGEHQGKCDDDQWRSCNNTW